MVFSSRYLFHFFLLSTLCLLLIDKANAQEEEFVGPFQSWANIKTRFKARGDGRTDDTKRIQQAIDELANYQLGVNTDKNPFTVIYFPAGTYVISQTLRLEGKIGITIIGEDPANTIIRWVGDNNDTMLVANGSAYFKISRFTWTSPHRVGVEALGVHWLSKWDTPKSRSYASLNIELSDMNFTDCAIGIGGGTMQGQTGTGSNDSEITIRRCNFVGCTEAGVKITGFNALDYWIWYCSFKDCKMGVYNAHGNYHIYRCNFSGSTQVDINNYGGYYTSVRESYSFNSREFSFDEGVSCNPFKRIFQRNTVVNYKTFAVEYYHLGNLSLFDNTFRSALKNDTPDIGLGSWCPGFYSVLSLNNSYTAKMPVRLTMEKRNPMRYGDAINVVKAAMVQRAELSLPARPRKIDRPIFEVPLNASTEDIQQIINKAAALKGQKAVVHFPPGKFKLNQSLVIPAGSEITLIGDGLAQSSKIIAADADRMAKTPLIVADGPSVLRISDLQFGEHTSEKKTSTSIEIRKIDKQGSRLIIDQMYSSTDTALDLRDMNYLYVEKNNSFFADGNYISGGSVQQKGKGTFSVNYIGGQFSKLTLKGNAILNAKDCWWEGPTRIPLDLTGDGTLSIDGAMISPYLSDSKPSIAIRKFAGKITLMNIYLYGGIGIDPDNPKLDVLGWNIHFYHNIKPTEAIDKKAKYRALLSGISCQCFETDKNPECGKMITFEPVAQNVKNQEQFIGQMTATARKPLFDPAPVNTTKTSIVYLSRVSMGTANTAIKVIQ